MNWLKSIFSNSKEDTPPNEEVQGPVNIDDSNMNINDSNMNDIPMQQAQPKKKASGSFGGKHGALDLTWLIEDTVPEQAQKTKATNGQPNSKYNDLNLQDLVQIEIDGEADKIKLSKDSQDLGVRISLRETKLEQIEKTLETEDNSTDATMDIFCIIDQSGSMRGARINQVKKSLHYLVDMLKPEDRISLILFDTVGEVLLAPKKISQSRDTIEAAIDSIKVRGMTNIAAGLELAFTQMVERKSRNQVTGVILLSDGQDNHEFQKNSTVVKEFFSKWTPKLVGNHYTLNCFGYGDSHDETLLYQIAELGSGNFYYVQNIWMVSDNFVDCLGDLAGVIGQNAKIDVNLQPTQLFPEIRFKKTYGVQFSGTKETQRSITVNNVTKGMKKDFMFYITLNGVKDPNSIVDDFEEVALISATILVENLSGAKQDITTVFTIPVYNEESEDKRNDNLDVKKNLVRVDCAEAIKEAQDCCDSGDYKAGQQILESYDQYFGDFDECEELAQMRSNLIKQKDAIKMIEVDGDCGYNLKAFSKNVECCAMNQVSAPQFMSMAENATKVRFKSKLASRKAGY